MDAEKLHADLIAAIDRRRLPGPAAIVAYGAAVQVANLPAELAGEFGRVLTEHTTVWQAPVPDPDLSPTERATLEFLGSSIEDAAKNWRANEVLTAQSNWADSLRLVDLGLARIIQGGGATITGYGRSWLEAHPRTEGGDPR